MRQLKYDMVHEGILVRFVLKPFLSLRAPVRSWLSGRLLAAARTWSSAQCTAWRVLRWLLLEC